VLISGEPGIGKSRLIVALSQRIESDPHTRLRYFCSPYHHDSVLYPFIARLERAAGFARGDSVEQRLVKLRDLLAPGARGEDQIELLAELLSLQSSTSARSENERSCSKHCCISSKPCRAIGRFCWCSRTRIGWTRRRASCST